MKEEIRTILEDLLPLVNFDADFLFAELGDLCVCSFFSFGGHHCFDGLCIAVCVHMHDLCLSYPAFRNFCRCHLNTDRNQRLDLNSRCIQKCNIHCHNLIDGFTGLSFFRIGNGSFFDRRERLRIFDICHLHGGAFRKGAFRCIYFYYSSRSRLLKLLSRQRRLRLCLCFRLCFYFGLCFCFCLSFYFRLCLCFSLSFCFCLSFYFSLSFRFFLSFCFCLGFCFSL